MEEKKKEILNEIIPEHFLGLKNLILHIAEAEQRPSKSRYLKDPHQGTF